MSQEPAQDSLATLQSMLNNVLVETGKALRNARKDGRGANVPNREPPVKMSETIRTFHQALDSLEQDIVSAKSVLQRDLNQMQQKTGQVITPKTETVQPSVASPQINQTPMPHPVDAQTKSPMVIDLESSPTASSPTVIKTEEKAPTATNGNGGVPHGLTNGVAAQAAATAVTQGAAATSAPTTSAAPEAPMQEAPMAPEGTATTMDMGTSAGPNNTTTTTEAGDNELNFTNMTFSLAPPNEDAPMSTNPQDGSFDMSNFVPANGGNDMALDNSFPDSNTNNNGQDASNAGAQEQDNTGNANGGGGSLDDFDWSLNEAAAFNENTGDGLDFDFSIGGEDTFNTLMNERDGEFSMDGGFDADPFNMNKSEGT